MYNLPSLRSEEDQNSVEKSDQRPWRGPLEESIVIPGRADQVSKCESRHKRSSKWDSKEDGNACSDSRVRHRDSAGRTTDDLDEQDRQWSVEYDLEHRVDGNEDGAVLTVAAC